MLNFHLILALALAALMGGDYFVAAGYFHYPSVSMESQFAGAIFHRHRIPIAIEVNQAQPVSAYRKVDTAAIRIFRQWQEMALFLFLGFIDAHLLTRDAPPIISSQSLHKNPVEFLKG